MNEEMHGGCYLTRYIVRQWLYDLYLDVSESEGRMMCR